MTIPVAPPAGGQLYKVQAYDPETSRGLATVMADIIAEIENIESDI